MLLTLICGLGSSGSAVEAQGPDFTGKTENPSLLDLKFNITNNDQMGDQKFRDRKINSLFLKSGFTSLIQLGVVYIICLVVLSLSRRYKNERKNIGNLWCIESEVQKKNRNVKYMIFKGLKQKIVWKNVLRALMTSFQGLIFPILLNIKKNDWTKIVGVVS